MRTAIISSTALATLLAITGGAFAGTKFQPIKAYTDDHSGNGLYPAGMSLSVKGQKLTVTNLATRKRVIATLDPSYKPRETRFQPYTMFRGTFRFDKWTDEKREYLIDLSDIAGKRAYVRYHGDQWGGIEIYQAQTKK